MSYIIFINKFELHTPKKKVFICGDRECINKKEAKRYFEENLSFEVKIIEKKNKAFVDLVEQNKRKKKTIKKFFQKKKMMIKTT